MEQIKTVEEITLYENTKSDFSDYPKFEGKKARRQYERLAFINNIEYTPTYDYPKLDFLIDDETLLEKKRQIYEAVLELEAAKSNDEHDKEELELFASYHEYRLKKIMLVEAARDLVSPASSADMEVNRRAFAELNEAVYGKFSDNYYFGMINSEKDRLNSFIPNSQLAYNISDWLSNTLQKAETGDVAETNLLSDIELKKMHDSVMNRYKNIFDVVPDTTDDVYYNAEECASIINQTLAVGGLAQFGWKSEVDSRKVCPSTSGKSLAIFLPSTTRRNSQELKRLIIHGQEVHARRSQNAKNLKIKPMQLGTANYTDVEEGLGVILEGAVSGSLDNASFDRARDRYITAGLALGIDGQPRDAREVYEILWRIFSIRSSKNGIIDEENVKKSKNDAYTHIENAYRGTQFWMKGVIYTKLKVYYEGLVKNAAYFKSHLDNIDEALDDALLGKYDHTDSEEVNLVKTIMRKKCGPEQH